MKFKKNTRRRALEYEKDLIQYWKKHQTFEKSVEMRPKGNSYVFYDGPPFITGVPHHGTLLTSVVKDAVPRYWTMQGKRVERVWGWDCHGLPAEVFTEKKLGISDKRDIGTKISLEEYINTCRENMVQTGSLWEDTVDRIGRWVDFKGAYKTMDKEYMESVWWAFKQLYEKGKIYEGERVLLYCTRDATPISKAEVAMDNSYQDVTDPSVFVKFKLTKESKIKLVAGGMPSSFSDLYMLAWTTTPWTLPANTGLAVSPHLNYAIVKLEGRLFVVATDLIEKIFTNEKHQMLDYEVVHHLDSAQDLNGLSYEPLFEDRGKNAHKVWLADYVTDESGTGIVHLAPAYGEEDFQLAKEKGLPVVSNIDDNGFYESGEWQGQYVWDANKPIAKALHERDIIWKIDYIRHSYPHCHRCGTKLMYRAHPSWFMDIEGQREQMLEENGSINWFPEHIKKGRSAKTIETAPDWNMSRDRFWATAMPVWKGIDADGKERVRIVGSYAELKELSGVELHDYHRPWIDDVTFTIDNVEYKRVEKVLDCWFESGSMPFAQFHYPFENVHTFEQHFPGDFIVEYVPQVRAWFYYLEAVSVGLFGKKAFKNALVHGTIAGNDGRKMSKSYGNYTDPNALMDQYSADSLRFLFLQSPLLAGEDFALIDKDVADTARKLSMVWNMYDFFTLYADVDDWEWNGSFDDPSEDLTNPLDQWIVSRLHQLNGEVEERMNAYDLPNATKPIIPFIEDASNWYVRRSRRRFWKGDSDSDKNDAYRTLHYVLVQLAHIMAPFTPFLAEELYRKLTDGESVHLRDWPKAGRVNELLVGEMTALRQLITDGLAQRASAGIKVRQPLRLAAIRGKNAQSLARFEDIITEELNVKSVLFDARTFAKSNDQDALVLEISTEIDDALREEGMMREVIRNVQTARKTAGLNVDDRIALSLSTTDAGLRTAIETHRKTIAAETLASEIVFDQSFAYESACSVNDSPLTISLQQTDAGSPQ